MKKWLVLILISAIYLFSGCVNEIAAQGGSVLRGASPTEPPYSDIRVPNDEDIVYVTPTGKKYHTADCPLLDESAIPITLKQALEQGMEPCSRCH